MTIEIVSHSRLSKSTAGTLSGFEAKERTTFGIRLPMMMRYEIETPKHLIAIAESKSTAREGRVIEDKAENDACRPTLAAERESK